jgi:Gram-negative bacterial TonB protein C-terminal
VKPALLLVALGLLLPFPAVAQPASKPVVYNNMDGDGAVGIDQAIKAVFGRKYAIVDTGRKAGYAEPDATAGELPKSARDKGGQALQGYVLAIYIVTAEGVVSDPFIVKTTDQRLSRVAMEAMADWRFTPGTLNGAPVATTAAQEFNFGPGDISGGYVADRAETYQPGGVLQTRMPPQRECSGYVAELEQVAHNFFVGASTPETFHIVVVLRPGGRSRVWFVSSIRPGNSPELEPLRKLLEAVPALAVHGGPVILGVSGKIAGGDGRGPTGAQVPIPAEWDQAKNLLKAPAAISSDTFLDLLWPDAP